MFVTVFLAYLVVVAILVFLVGLRAAGNISMALFAGLVVWLIVTFD